MHHTFNMHAYISVFSHLVSFWILSALPFTSQSSFYPSFQSCASLSSRVKGTFSTITVACCIPCTGLAHSKCHRALNWAPVVFHANVVPSREQNKPQLLEGKWVWLQVIIISSFYCLESVPSGCNICHLFSIAYSAFLFLPLKMKISYSCTVKYDYLFFFVFVFGYDFSKTGFLCETVPAVLELTL